MSEIAVNRVYAENQFMPRPRKPRSEDPWKQRPRFCDLVDQSVAAGATLDEIAAALGLTSRRSLEISYRYDHSRIPKRTTIEAAAAYFGVPVSEIYGDDNTSEIQRARRMVEDAMGADVVATLTDEQVLEAYKVALATARAMLSK